MAAITVLLLLVSILGLSSARPDGAPMSACENLTPAAGAHGAPSTTDNPYTLVIDGLISAGGRYYYDVGQTYTVTLRGVVNTTMFQGFLVQLRLAADQSIVGNQLSENSADIQQHNCVPATGGFTHVNANNKGYIRFQWTPRAGTGAVVFRYTVVETRPGPHWDGASSNTIYENEPSSCNGSTTVGGTFLYWATRRVSLDFIFRRDLMEGQYAAVGFSMNQMMVQTDIVVGAVGANGVYFVDDRFATGPPRSMPQPDTNQNLIRTAASITNGRIEVRFTRLLYTGDSQDFNLTADSSSGGNCFYLLTAWGQVGNFSARTIMQHSSTARAVSMQQYCFCSGAGMITGLSVWLLLMIAAVQYLL